LTHQKKILKICSHSYKVTTTANSFYSARTRLRFEAEDVLALHVRWPSSVVPKQGGGRAHGGDVLAVRLCVHWLAVRNASVWL
jgi:hypothetical protein